MGIKNKPYPLTVPRGFKQEGLQRRIQRRLPIGFRPNLAVGKSGYEIEHFGAAVFEAVGRMLERLDAINAGATLARRSGFLSRSGPGNSRA